MTTNPEDAFVLFRTHVMVAKEYLHGSDLVNLVLNCANTLKGYQNQQNMRLKVSWRIMSLEMQCAIVNDNVRFQVNTTSNTTTTTINTTTSATNIK